MFMIDGIKRRKHHSILLPINLKQHIKINMYGIIIEINQPLHSILL